MKSKIIISLKILISIILLMFLMRTSKLDFNLFYNLFDSEKILSCIIILYLITIGLSTWRWYKLNIAQGILLSFSHTLFPTYIGIAFNNVLPGGISGDFFRFFFLNKHTKINKSVIMLSILTDRITGLLGIFIMLGLIAVVNIDTKTILIYLPTLTFIASTGIIIYFLSQQILSRIYQWLNHSHQDNKWVKPFSSLLSALRIYNNSKIIIVKCLITSVFIQILITITCMLIARMMGFPSISFSHYMIAAAITQIVNLIPIAPGGFGVGEIAFSNVLIFLNPGSPTTSATIFLAYRMIGIAIYLPGVIGVLFNLPALKSNLE